MQIIKYPHPTLRHVSKPLRRVDRELRDIVRGMFALMYEHKGIGLAANQVDLPYRLFVLNVENDPEKKDAEHVFINPVISQRHGMAEREEGCLSFPRIYAPVRRPEKVTLAAYDLSGREIRYELSGLFARAAQHEVDHLDGKLFIDFLGPDDLAAIGDDLRKLEQEFAGQRSEGLIPADESLLARLSQLEQLRT